MIPASYIQEWSTKTPWPTPQQVEQDLVISRAYISRGFRDRAAERVTMELGPNDLMLLDRDMHWTVVPGAFDLMVGKSSVDIELTGTLHVEGANPLTGQGLNR